LHSRRVVHRDVKSMNVLVKRLSRAPELEYSEGYLNAKLADLIRVVQDKKLKHQICQPDTQCWYSEMDGSRGVRNHQG
jgi:serine/threonine protein kinase